MFRDYIKSYQTEFTTEDADQIFQNICGGVYHDDCTFLATARALLGSRISKEERLRIYCYDYITKDSGENISRVIQRYIPGEDNCITMLNLLTKRGSPVYGEVISRCPDSLPGDKEWVKLDKVTDFFIKTFNVTCYTCPKDKSVVLICENLSIRTYHYLQCGLLAFLPWYFDPKDGMTSEEMDLIMSLREKDSSKYIRSIDAISKGYDFRTIKIKRLLSNFERAYEEGQIESVKSNIRDVQYGIEELYNRISDSMRSLREYQIRLMGLETKVNSGCDSSEIMEYFLSNEKLCLLSVRGSSVEFASKDYLSYFDEDVAQAVIDNPASYVYSGLNSAGKEKVKKLMTAIFLDQKIKIMICAAYKMDIRNMSVFGLQRYDFPKREFENCIPNPHIDEYRCLGTYEMEILKAIQRGDYLYAIEQCVASSKSINFSDSIVMQKFMGHICDTSGDNIKFIELPDGTMVDPNQAYEWLKSQE